MYLLRQGCRIGGGDIFAPFVEKGEFITEKQNVQLSKATGYGLNQVLFVLFYSILFLLDSFGNIPTPLFLSTAKDFPFPYCPVDF